MREGWKGMKIADICEKASSNIALNKIQDIDGDYPIYGASGYIKNVDFYHRDKAYIGVVKDGSGVGRVNTYPPMTSLLGTMQYILPKDGYCLGYVAYALKSLNLASFASGAAIPHIYFRDYGQCEICVPSLQEQERIVAELDLLTGIIDKQKQQLKELDTLAQSIFYDMFGNPVENEKGWELKSLGDISVKISNGYNAKLEEGTYKTEGIMYFRCQNVWRNRFDYSDLVYIDEQTNAIMKSSSLKKNDFVITKIGRLFTENSSLGRVSLYEGEDDKANISGNLCFVRLKDGVCHKFILYILISEHFRDYVRNTTTGGIDKRALNCKQVASYNVILPPLELQKVFSEKVKAIESQKEFINRSIAESQKLFDYTMDKYFG